MPTIAATASQIVAGWGAGEEGGAEVVAAAAALVIVIVVVGRIKVKNSMVFVIVS